MPLFDITSGIKAQYTSGATPQVAYDIMKKIVVTFAKRGYTVSWAEQKPPDRVVAKLSDKDGTDLAAEVNVVDEGTTTRCDINIHGHVFLGGILGRLVSASTIQSRASEKIKEMLDENFAGQPSKRAAVAKAPQKAAAPSTLPPGHPGARAPAPASAGMAAQAPAAAPAANMSTAPASAEASGPYPAVSASAAAPSNPVRTSTTDESWQALSERVLAGASVEPKVLIARASSAAGALGDATLIQFVQIALVQALSRTRGKKLDRGAAAQLLTRIAPASSQTEMASSSSGKLAGTTAAYALTAALGEVVQKALDESPADEVLKDLFGEAFERIRGEKSAAQQNGASPIADKIEQVQEAYDADLLSEAEMLVLKERVLASL